MVVYPFTLKVSTNEEDLNHLASVQLAQDFLGFFFFWLIKVILFSLGCTVDSRYLKVTRTSDSISANLPFFQQFIVASLGSKT